jgi:SepF-like predicted cell division protein (DUF552 family)
MIVKDTIVTLDDNKEYMVMSVVEIDNERYVILTEIENVNNQKICIEEIKDGKLLLTDIPSCEENKDIFLKIISKLSKEFDEQE